ncbi:S41 family peptidase [Tissierella pigra]|uniref:S41 family peptidase n=1 Tax=Tissierella pigra TaxID=2607614 RepID=UPI001C1138D7|nr:S41 family peptidase [Tissierella pigra]MBU5427933.1 S41 family peptidase [Tissierella pigra]
MKKTIAFLLILTLLIPSTVWGESQSTYEEKEANLLFFVDVLDYIQEKYPFEIDEDKLIEGALKGMLGSLDPYSDYYNSEEAEIIYKNLFGTFGGIGVTIEEKEGYINIKNTLKDQPAQKAGIKENDLIVSVDNMDIKNLPLEKVSSMIQGEKGTAVKLGIKRGSEVLTFNIKRDIIEISPVKSEILKEKIGYIKIEEFNSQTTVETKKALNEFDNKKITKVILDLRDNPGGQLSEAVTISNLFVPKGDVVHIKEKNKALLTHVSTLEKSKYKLAVLVNENSASASEIVAGAIKDRKAGTLIGTKTFGKGIVQTLMPVDDGSIIKMTTAEYLTPNKISIHGKGIEPDIKVENTDKDLQLNKAIEILK